MIRGSRLLVAAAASSVLLLLGACGGGDESTGGAGGATGAPVSGGEARVLLLNDPRTLDPAALGNAYASGALLGNALYGTLLVNDEKGALQPSMAESFESADGGATFDLKLRPGLVFSDGSPLDAAAVKFNWDRIKDPALGSVNRAEASMIASSEVVDAVTLRATLVSPIPKYSEAVVTTALNWVASPAALRAGSRAFDEKPVGAGPFTLRSWTRQADIRLARNPRYWDAPKPYLDGLVLRAALDNNQRYNTVITGGADIAIDSSWVNLDKAGKAGLATNFLEASGGLFAALNMRRAPFDDIRARQAFVKAIDLEALNLAVYNGTARMTESLFSEASPFYADKPLHQFDREGAQRLLDELAADGKPLSFTFTTTPNSENRKMAENLQAQLASYQNVKFQARIIEIAEFAALRTSHDYDAVITSALFQDPDPRLPTAFLGSSPANLPGINDPDLNASLLAGRTATSDGERARAYDTVQDRLIELAPALFLARGPLGTIGSKNVGGFQQYGLGSLLPEEIWIRK